MTRKPLHASFSDVITQRYDRVITDAGSVTNLVSAHDAAQEASHSALTFQEIAKSTSGTHDIAPGYEVNVLLRWGDKVLSDAPEFDPYAQTAEGQAGQFGFNSDFIAFLPLPYGSGSSNHGLLCVNHEYTAARSMFRGMNFYNAPFRINKDQVDVEQMAHGHSVVEIRKDAESNTWEPVIGGTYNRRYNAAVTKISLKGPAAGHTRMRTSADQEGKTVIGTFANCAGGVTPWGSVLFCEENFEKYFTENFSGTMEEANHTRYRIGKKLWYGWHRFYDRYDTAKELNEPNRYGWVIEYDPYDPQRLPMKRTALGRFSHETATTALAPDGRVVVYSGDDGYSEYLYRFVSSGKYAPDNREKNFGLLDEGTLSVARFKADGKLEWLPLVYGTGQLTEENGFSSQADVVIEARRAGDIVGATPMDRPEGIAINPHTGRVYVSLTFNYKRKPEEVNPANSRPYNYYGQIIELLPPDADHAADAFEWNIFLLGGDPKWPQDGASYQSPVSENGWLACPDNLAVDPSGRLWVTTDCQPRYIDKNDSVYAVETSGERRGATRLFFNCPFGSEATGPCFTPDGKTLFLSIQNPGDNQFTYAEFDLFHSRWPDFQNDMPPRPSVIAITKKGGGIIGS